MDYAEMGRRIRSIRRQMNLTQQQLAELVGISTSFIGHIERGSRITSLETFVRLCTALNASPAYLLSLPEKSIHLPLTNEEHEQFSRLLRCACQAIQHS